MIISYFEDMTSRMYCCDSLIPAGTSQDSAHSDGFCFHAGDPCAEMVKVSDAYALSVR